MESSKSRRVVNQQDGSSMRIRNVAVDVDPPPAGLETVAMEDQPHVMGALLAAYQIREHRQERPVGWSITPQIVNRGHEGSITTGYDGRVWGWSDLSLSELIRIRDGCNPAHIKELVTELDYPWPTGDGHGCLRLVMSSHAGEDSRRISQAPVTAPSAADVGTVLGSAPPPPSAASTVHPPIAPAVVAAPVDSLPPQPPPPPPPQPSKKRTLLSLIGL